ncbi:MAG: ABC transporter permease [Novipirellula sp. JB048]
MRLITVTIVIALALGVPAAWAVTTLAASRRFANHLAHLFLLAMLVAVAMPMILHAAAWEATAGKFGWLALSQTTTRSAAGFAGLVACGWIHGLYGAAIVAIATWHGTQLVPKSILQLASLDAHPLRVWWTIALPLAWPWVLAATIASAVLAATEMTVVDLYGYRTLAEEFYLLYAVAPSITSILTTIALPLCFALALITVLLGGIRSRRHESAAAHFQIAEPPSVGESASPGTGPSPGIRCAAIVILFATVMLILAIPLAGLVSKLGHEVVVDADQRTVSWSATRALRELAAAPRTFASEYQWTLILAGVTGCFATAMAWPLAAIGREHQGCERVLDACSSVAFCIPGPLVGMLLVNFFQLPLGGARFLYEATIVPTVLAMSVRATTIAYWIIRSGYHGIGDSVLVSAKLDAGRWRRLWRIDRPLLTPSLLLAVIGAGIVASGDVPVTLPVAPPGVSTVGTRLFGLLHSGARYQEAALALWYLGLISVIIIVTATHLRRRRAKIGGRSGAGVRSRAGGS